MPVKETATATDHAKVAAASRIVGFVAPAADRFSFDDQIRLAEIAFPFEAISPLGGAPYEDIVRRECGPMPEKLKTTIIEGGRTLNRLADGRAHIPAGTIVDIPYCIRQVDPKSRPVLLDAVFVGAMNLPSGALKALGPNATRHIIDRQRQAYRGPSMEFRPIETFDSNDAGGCEIPKSSSVKISPATHPWDYAALGRAYGRELEFAVKEASRSIGTPSSRTIAIFDTGFAGFQSAQARSIVERFFAPHEGELKVLKTAPHKPPYDPDYGRDIYGMNFDEKAGLGQSPSGEESILSMGDGHGTEMAFLAIAGGGDAPMAPRSMPNRPDILAPPLRLKMINMRPGGEIEWNTEEGVSLAIDYLAKIKTRAEIVNMSVGATIARPEHVDDLADKFREAKDLLFVAAAGNAGQVVDKYGRPSNHLKGVVYPALFGGTAGSNVITVAAFDPFARRRLPSSNYSQRFVDLAAPGCEIHTRSPAEAKSGRLEVKKVDGSSVAAALTSFTAGLVSSLNPDLTPAEIKQRLLTASDYEPNLLDQLAFPVVINPFKAISLRADVVEGPSGTLHYYRFSDKQVAALRQLCDNQDDLESNATEPNEELARIVDLQRHDPAEARYEFWYVSKFSQDLTRMTCRKAKPDDGLSARYIATPLEGFNFKDISFASGKSLLRDDKGSPVVVHGNTR